MNRETKLELVTSTFMTAITIAEAVFIHWVGNVNWWVAWLIAACFSTAVEAQRKVRANRALFDIADRELVRVSALANSLEEKVADLESEVETLKIAQL